MKRITKYEPSKDSMFPYKLVDNELSTELDAIHQLGRFEDLMEEYNINSIQELENTLSSKFIAGGSRSGGKSIVAKGMLYNKLSEELGCPLEVVFKAYKETIVFKKIDCITKEEHVLEGVKNKLIYNGKEFVLHTYFKYKKYYYLHILELKDYQKTWWLKGEKENV